MEDRYGHSFCAVLSSWSTFNRCFLGISCISLSLFSSTILIQCYPLVQFFSFPYCELSFLILISKGCNILQQSHSGFLNCQQHSMQLTQWECTRRGRRWWCNWWGDKSILFSGVERLFVLLVLVVKVVIGSFFLHFNKLSWRSSSSRWSSWSALLVGTFPTAPSISFHMTKREREKERERQREETVSIWLLVHGALERGVWISMTRVVREKDGRHGWWRYEFSLLSVLPVGCSETRLSCVCM